MTVNDLTIVVCCNKNDFFMARICIASIRYYYPDIPMEIVKDSGNGYFDTKRMEKCFNIKNIDLGVEKMGWSGAKFHYLFHAPKGKKVLLLDADIVFIGPFLERLLPLIEENDYVVSIEEEPNPYADWVKSIYFDTKMIESNFPDYEYPGYFFNAGQIFVATGSIEKNILDRYFDRDNFPYWKKKELFPLVDQSVYNYLLPTLDAEKKIKLGKDKFMVWAKSDKAATIKVEALSDKSVTDGLIHWAGCVRFEHVSKMIRGDILIFFENFFYSQVKMNKVKGATAKIIPMSEYYLKQLYYKLKPSNWLKR